MGLHNKLAKCMCVYHSLSANKNPIYNLWSFQSMLGEDWAVLLYLDEDELDLGSTPLPSSA
jgi:hypothetical protein